MFHKYPKIRRLNDLFIGEEAPGFRDLEGFLNDPDDAIVIQEKIDGANFRFMITEDGNIIFGSRNNVITDDDTPKNFRRAVDFVIDAIDGYIDRHGKASLKRDFGRKIFYMEGCWKHSTSYDFENMPIAIGYDVYELALDRWYPYPECKFHFDTLNLPFVPVIQETIAGAIKPFKDEDVPISKYNHNQAEGIMIKNYNKGIFAKYVTEKHKEESRKVFGGKTPPEIDLDILLTHLANILEEHEYKYIEKRIVAIDEQFLVDKYCTNPRIDKFIFKLVDEGYKLEMALMRHLPKLIIQDIYDEHFEGIYNSRKDYFFDFQRYKKLVGGRCKSVLEQIIHNKIHGEKE